MTRTGGWRERAARIARRLASSGGLALAAAAAVLTATPAAQGGTLTREAVAARFPSPLIVGERDPQFPLWPLFRQDGTSVPLVGYVFESIDFAPLPGFSGTPPDLLVALDAQGRFLDVAVLSQHEPVFLDGLGPAALDRFVAQYRGLSLKQNIKVGSAEDRQATPGGANTRIDGVAKATASVRIVNQALLASALQVARARLGFGGARDPDQVARVRPDLRARADWAALEAAGYVLGLDVTNADVARAFAGTGVDDAPAAAAGGGFGAATSAASPAPSGPAGASYVALRAAWLSAPMAGRNLLGEAGWQRLQGRLEPGDHAILVLARGPGRFVGDDWVRGAVPERLTLSQDGLPIEWRDMDLDEPVDPRALPADWRGADAKVLRVIGAAGLDPSRPAELALHVVRSRGQVYAERVRRTFTLPVSLPREAVVLPERESRSWVALWRARAGEIAVLLAALASLAAVLARPRWLGWLVADERRLDRFRLGFLAFTLGFVGWFAQGQLSIVNVTAALQALVAGRSLAFFLQDPMTVLLWAFTLPTLVVWGRGTFCGWLCPFGALQELVARAGGWLGVRRRRPRAAWDARLKRVKFVVLGALVALAAWPGAATAPWVDRGVEVEPFKTAITLGFDRSWPFVAFALAAVLVGALWHKAFCRWLCPLGGALAVLGRLRRWDWIARRAECGTPCQTCRHRCAYQAIAPSGRVDYDECHQCLDCVAIHASDTRCAPRIQARRHRVIAIRPLPGTAAAGGAREGAAR